MICRLTTQRDLPRLLHMVDQAEASFRARGIDQWQKDNLDGSGLAAAIKQKTVYVLEQEGQAVGMIIVVPGLEASHAQIDSAQLNQEPYAVFYRACVEEPCKDRGIAAQLFGWSEDLVRYMGLTNIRIGTHPDSRSIQRALAKSGCTLCGNLTLTEDTEKGDPRLAYHKILQKVGPGLAIGPMSTNQPSKSRPRISCRSH